MFILIALLAPFLGTKGAITLILFVAVAGLSYRYIKKKQKYWEEKGVNHIKPKFFTGNIEIIRSKPICDSICDWYKEFPEDRYHGIYQLINPVLLVKDPDLIKQITVKEFDHFLNHQDFVSADTDPFWSKNLFASRDERWKDMRSTLSPSFTSSKMKMMFTLMDECAEEFVKYFKDQNQEVVELEVKDTLRRYTNDVIATTAFGIKYNSLKNRNNEFYLMGADASNFGTIRSLKIFLYGALPSVCKLFGMKLIPTKVATYFSQIIENTVETRKEKNIVRPDMIHLLMEAQKGRHHQDEDVAVNEGFSSVQEFDLKRDKKQEITIEDISSQAFIFFLAGFETVSTFLTFAFYEIAVNPEVQKRLREEFEAVSGKITYEVLLGMKYLDMVVSEALRKWPPAIVTNREVSKDYTIEPQKPGEKPLLLQKGESCWIPVFAIHRDPKFYSNPEEFNPDRFSEENKHKINPWMYLPFGAGPRNCIGSRFALLEAKLIIFHVLKNFELVKTAKTTNPVVIDKSQFNLTAKGGMWLGLKKIVS